MAEESFQEKTERATPKKRSKAREEGQVAKSAEIASVLVLLVGISMLFFFSAYFYPKLAKIMEGVAGFETIPNIDRQFCVALLRKSVFYFLIFVLPIMGAVFLAAFVANYAQVGFQFSSKAITPKISKFNIVSGFGRLFSLRSFVEMAKQILKLSIIGTVAYFAVRGEIPEIRKLYDAEVAYIFMFTLKGFMKIFIWVLIVMVVVAVADYSFQKWQYEKDLRMTKQEVKEEHKESEGDPQVKSRIRSIQLQAARKRMMQAVPDADVVVTNPTHLAVAIKYDPLNMRAPMVLAKGAGRVAQRIREIAGEHNIPVVENKELARNLYKAIDVGETIGSDFYKGVAELLAYVYKLKGKTVS
jgi:flagellar biosynthetic protein FlhB